MMDDFYDNFMETLGTLGGEEEISVSDLDSGPTGMIL